MKYLTEKLIRHDIIREYSSLVYRYDFSDAKYAFEFPIDENITEEDIKNELIEDIFKLTLSIRNHTGGVTHITKEDMEPVEINDPFTLEDSYGGCQYLLYVIFPSRMGQYKPKKILQGYWIPIPGRPRAIKLNRYYSKIVNIISTKGTKKSIANPAVKQIMNEVSIYGLENLNSFDFYVFEDKNYSNENRYHIIMTYNFKDSDAFINNRSKDKSYIAELKRQEELMKKQDEERRRLEQEQLEKDRKKYFEEKRKYLSQFSGPEKYYAEKDWLRTYGDPRFEDFGSMRRSNYTGD